jgi:hypothetical protein
MNTERLLLAVRAIEEAEHPERFAMAGYIHGPDPYGALQEYPKAWCGSPACILGHLAAREDLQDFFKAQDMSLVYNTPIDEWSNYVSFTDARLSAWFGLTSGEMLELFGSEGCGGATTVEEASEYIKQFIALKDIDSRQEGR